MISIVPIAAAGDAATRWIAFAADRTPDVSSFPEPPPEPQWIEVRSEPSFWASALWVLLLLSWPIGTLIALFGWKPSSTAVVCADCGHERRPAVPSHHENCPFYEGGSPALLEFEELLTENPAAAEEQLHEDIRALEVCREAWRRPNVCAEEKADGRLMTVEEVRKVRAIDQKIELWTKRGNDARRAARLGELAEQIRRLHTECSEEFKRTSAYESARRFLAKYEASGPSDQAAALAEQAARETQKALSTLVADVPDVAHRDRYGEQWTPTLRLVDGTLDEDKEPMDRREARQ
jgi:hypothetical protein